MPRRRKYAEVWIGLLVLVSAGLVTWGYFWLTGQPLEARGYELVAEIRDAQGIERGARVRVSGVAVGSVRSVDLITPTRVAVRFQVREDVRLPRDTRAVLETASLFGDQVIQLYPGESESFLEGGDTVAAALSPGLTQAADDLSRQAGSVLSQVERMLADTTITQIHGSVAALQDAVGTLAQFVDQNSDELSSLSRSLSRTAQTLESSLEGPRVESTVADLERTASILAETAGDLRASSRSLASISAKIDRGDGTLGMLVNDPVLYEELRTATRSISDLLRDVRENPGRYVTVKVF